MKVPTSKEDSGFWFKGWNQTGIASLSYIHLQYSIVFYVNGQQTFRLVARESGYLPSYYIICTFSHGTLFCLPSST